jgi:hypothetical protein
VQLKLGRFQRILSTTKTMSYSIYEGLWIDWTMGRWRGATIALSSGDGALLLAFIATFIALVSIRLWRIISFVLHQIHATHHAHDELHFLSMAHSLMMAKTSQTTHTNIYSHEATQTSHTKSLSGSTDRTAVLCGCLFRHYRYLAATPSSSSWRKTAYYTGNPTETLCLARPRRRQKTCTVRIATSAPLHVSKNTGSARQTAKNAPRGAAATNSSTT